MVSQGRAEAPLTVARRRRWWNEPCKSETVLQELGQPRAQVRLYGSVIHGLEEKAPEQVAWPFRLQHMYLIARDDLQSSQSVQLEQSSQSVQSSQFEQFVQLSQRVPEWIGSGVSICVNLCQDCMEGVFTIAAIIAILAVRLDEMRRDQFETQTKSNIYLVMLTRFEEFLFPWFPLDLIAVIFTSRSFFKLC